MKKNFIFTILMVIICSSAYADEQVKIKISDNHTKETVELGFCNIFIEKGEVDDADNTSVSIQVENLKESNDLLIFGHAFPESELKKMRPSIVFDKHFPGTKGQREIDTYNGIRHDLMIISPSDKYNLPNLLIAKDETKQCRIPIYIAYYKDKSQKKLLVCQEEIIQLDIETEVKPDVDYIRLSGKCDSLLVEFEELRFCTNKNHKKYLDGFRPKNEEGIYLNKLFDLKLEIKEVIDRRNYYSSDKKYIAYDELLKKLEKLDVSKLEGDCGKHAVLHPAVSKHSCEYDNLTFQQIYHRLDDYNKQIYVSRDRDRKAAKASVMKNVNLLYRCCTDPNCKKHAPFWKKSEYSAKIIEVYNKITSY